MSSAEPTFRALETSCPSMFFVDKKVYVECGKRNVRKKTTHTNQHRTFFCIKECYLHAEVVHDDWNVAHTSKKEITDAENWLLCSIGGAGISHF